uniref:Translation initiation factor 5A-like N-terminal domain-containing protein n=1 Tax=Sphaeramia orbicularis TaxID=375764 RepID=A0A673CS68_9TELE
MLQSESCCSRDQQTAVENEEKPHLGHNIQPAAEDGAGAGDRDIPDTDGGHRQLSTTFPMQCSALQNNGYMSTSETGKHGHVHLVGTDIFTQRKYDDICPSTHNMDVPHVCRKDYQVMFTCGTDRTEKTPSNHFERPLEMIVRCYVYQTQLPLAPPPFPLCSYPSSPSQRLERLYRKCSQNLVILVLLG